MTRSIFDPPAYIIPGEIKPVQQQVFVAQEAPLQFNCNEDVHKYSLYQTYNTKLSKDGHTYTKLDKDGNYISHYVSPYAKKFWSGMNVETGIEPVVRALWEKGYLTFTSCQGHQDSPMRYVGVTFVNNEERTKFVDQLKHLPVNWHFNCVNPVDDPLEVDDGNWMRMQWDQTGDRIQTQQEFTDQRYTTQQLTDFWNIMFSRNYANYSPLIMCVGCTMYPKNTLDYYWWKVKYHMFRDKSTSKVADYINKNLSYYYW